jgi:hypothetical protein
LYGIPCLYYGTEQFLQGNGLHDCWLREPLFNKNGSKSFHNPQSELYKEISRLALIRKEMSIFMEGLIEIDSISINGAEFISAEYTNGVIYWSKRVFEDKLILLYNPKRSEKQSISVKLSRINLRIKSKFRYVYGGIGEEIVKEKNGCGYINIDLNPQQFVILR